jgi:predicted nucleotidyltransferase component of viral defense system
MTRDVAASVRARLLNRAKQAREEFELFLVRYGCERFLYRLGASEVRERCILKGAALLTLWMGNPYRATRDLDFLARGPTTAASIREIVTTICAVPCSEDGLVFDLDSLGISPLRAEQEHQGYRAVLRAFLGAARIRLQVDFGFGDAVTPEPEEVEYPTLLAGLPAPRLRSYRREVTLAEKLEAMVVLGRRNSRMKDFHDVWELSSAFAFDGPVLRLAVVACLERRGTVWTEELPDALGSSFYSHIDLQTRWSHYLRAGSFHALPPASFELVGDRILHFFGPLRDSMIANVGFGAHWEPGGPWR